MKRVGYVVEGFNDEKKVLEVVPDAHIVVTKGTRFNNRVRMDIRYALETCENVYVLTDPDPQGDQLAAIIQAEFPELDRIQIDSNEAHCIRNHKLKTGVEHCSPEYLKTILIGG